MSLEILAKLEMFSMSEMIITFGPNKKNTINTFHISIFLFYLYKIEGDINYKDVFLKTLQLKPAIVYLDFYQKT